MNKASRLIPKPYKGLIPYSEADRLFFFGREREREIITEKLKAWNLTILYGASGIGKSSLLRAGVAYNLSQVAKKNVDETGKPGWAIIVFPPVESELAKRVSWQDPLTGIKEQLKHEIARLLSVSLAEIEKRFEEAITNLNLVKKTASSSQHFSLVDMLRAWLYVIEDNKYSGKLFIILDQFEEYLVQRQPKINDNFLIEFQQAVNCSEICVNFLISIREEFLASLDCLVDIQNLFKNRRTIKHLDRESAREAIVYPLREYNRQKVILEKLLDNSPLTILAGERGSHKSTILRSGVTYYLRKNNLNVTFFNGWHKSKEQNLLNVFKTKIFHDLDRYKVFSNSKPKLSLAGTLTDTLSEWIKHFDRQNEETILFIILDQFEEYFRQQPEQDPDLTFINELLGVVNDSSLNIKFLISIRKNWLSELEDILQNRLPDTCQHYLQLNAKSEHYIQEKLLFSKEEDSEQEELQRQLEAEFIEIEEGLDEYILHKFKEESQEKIQSHHNTEESDIKAELEVEAPYLQLIMTRLWDEDIEIKPEDNKNTFSSKKLCKKTFEIKLGGLRGIVEKHFESQISRLSDAERDIAARIFPFLVTKSGIKFALPVEDLRVYANKGQKKQLTIKQVKDLLDKLSNITSESEQKEGKENYRILHSVPGIRGEICYEIFHDMLAEPIIAWQTDYDSKKSIEEANREKEKRIRSAKKQARLIREEGKKQASKITKIAMRMATVVAIMSLAITTGAIIAIRSIGILAETSDLRAKYYECSQSIENDKGVATKNSCFGGDKQFPSQFLLSANKLRKSKWFFKLIGRTFADSYLSQEAGIMRILASELSKKTEVLFPEKEIPLKNVKTFLNVSSSLDGKQIVAGLDNSKLYLWNLQDKPIKEPEIISSNGNLSILSVSFSTDGNQIATGSADGILRLWNLRNKPIEKSKSLQVGNVPILSVSFSTDGNRIATGSADGILRLWNIKKKHNDKPIEKINTNPTKSKLKTINFSPDEKYFAIVFSPSNKPSNKPKESALQQEIDLWDLKSRQIVYNYPLELNTENDEIVRISFSPDGKQIAAVARDGAVKLLPIYTFDELLNEACNLLLNSENKHKHKEACNLLNEQIENKKQEV